jgi:pimeloyl-ACP methyl ester carboxylesterase
MFVGHSAHDWESIILLHIAASFTQPVYHEFKDLKVPTLLLIGTCDTTAIGSDIAPPEVKATLGHYEVLGKQVAKLIPLSTLIEFPGLGHAPQMEEPAKFHQALLDWLNKTNPVR